MGDAVLQQGCRSREGPCSPPNFEISVNPISTRGQIMPTTLLLAAAQIFRPTYGPATHHLRTTYIVFRPHIFDRCVLVAMKIDIGFSFSEAFIAHMSREMSSLSNSPSMIRTPNFS